MCCPERAGVCKVLHVINSAKAGHAVQPGLLSQSRIGAALRHHDHDLLTCTAVAALDALGEDSAGTAGTTSVGHARKRPLSSMNQPITEGAGEGGEGMGGIMEGSEEGEDEVDEDGVVDSRVGEGPTPQRRRRGGGFALLTAAC